MRASFVLCLGVISVGAVGCATDLGTCDDNLARTPYYNALGYPAYGGQALVEVSCANGQCHTKSADGAQRVGAPAGLNFDMIGSRAEPGPDTEAVQLLKRGQDILYEWRSEAFETVDDGSMPPGAIGESIVAGAYSGAKFSDALDNPLPKLDSSAGNEMLKNWLACGAPVVEALGDSGQPFGTCVGGDSVGDRCAKKEVQVDASWASIYNSAFVSCFACHGAAGTMGDLDMMTGGKDGAYERMVGIAAMATGGSGGDCSASGSQRIVAGDADASLLIQKLEGTVVGGGAVCGDRMPIGTPLTQAQIDVIRDWIDAGAENN
ncbi:MAG: hypothetical protein KC417_13375 [Myxococcales bacterium]|nr:hypothetical protein [Myxococcales bacterium]